MNKLTKALVLGSLILGLGACSSMTTVSERETYAMPSWYKKCEQSGTEGWLFWKEEYVYSCGSGVSIFHQGAEEEMYAFAINNFAKRINSEVNSNTKLKFVDDNGKESRATSTTISYVVKDTTIREHIAKETGTFKYQGKMFTFVKLRMPKTIFDELIQEAKSAKVSVSNN